MSISKVYCSLIEDKNTILKNVKFQSDHVILQSSLRRLVKCCSCNNSLHEPIIYNLNIWLCHYVAIE